MYENQEVKNEQRTDNLCLYNLNIYLCPEL